MRTFRVSNLEQFRLYRTEPEDSIYASTTEEIVAMLCGEFVPSAKMEAGTALHAVLETIDAAGLEGEEFTRVVSPDGRHAFVFECDIPLTLEPLREVALSRVYTIDGEEVLVTGHVDTLGARVGDHKLAKSFDAEFYADSYQWRGYLSLTGLDEFVYRVFQYLDPLAHTIANPPVEYRIKAYHPLRFWRYPEMEADFVRELGHLLRFAKEQGIPENVVRSRPVIITTEDCSACDGRGHKEGCDSLEPSWDVGDLIARSGCVACCPNGCQPAGFQALQDECATRARRLLSG